MTSPVRVEKRTSAAKAVKRSPFYGTAEAVPFVGQSLPQSLRVSEGFMGWPNWPTEKPNLDMCEVQPSLRDSISRLDSIQDAVPNLNSSLRARADRFISYRSRKQSIPLRIIVKRSSGTIARNAAIPS